MIPPLWIEGCKACAQVQPFRDRYRGTLVLELFGFHLELHGAVPAVESARAGGTGILVVQMREPAPEQPGQLIATVIGREMWTYVGEACLREIVAFIGRNQDPLLSAHQKLIGRDPGFH